MGTDTLKSVLVKLFTLLKLKNKNIINKTNYQEKYYSGVNVPGILLKASRPVLWITDNLNWAFIAGSSKQGNALLASVDSICEVTNHLM